MEKRERTRKHERRQKFQQKSNDSKEQRQDKRESEKSDKSNEKTQPAEKKVIDHTAIPDPHMFDNLKRETDEIAALTVKKFNKRQVFSNWSRYEVTTGPAEEEDKKIGTDFETLLQSAQFGAHFQSKSERSWDPSSVCARSGLFTLNINTLADGLSCLPLYERLGLSLSLFSNEELEEMERRSKAQSEAYLPSVKSSRVKRQLPGPEPLAPEPALALYEEEAQLSSLSAEPEPAPAPQLQLNSQPDSREPSVEKTNLDPQHTEIAVLPTQPKTPFPAPTAVSKQEPHKSTPRGPGDSLDFGMSHQEAIKRVPGLSEMEACSGVTAPEYGAQSPEISSPDAQQMKPAAPKLTLEEVSEAQPGRAQKEEVDEERGVRKQRGKGNRAKTNNRRSLESEGAEVALPPPNSGEIVNSTPAVKLADSEQDVKPVVEPERLKLEAKPEIQLQNTEKKSKRKQRDTPAVVCSAPAAQKPAAICPTPAVVCPAPADRKPPTVPPTPAVASKEDDQLDFLLSLKKAVPQPTLLLAKPSSAVRSTLDDDEPPDVVPAADVGKKTEELEDWLDSMLDN